MRNIVVVVIAFGLLLGGCNPTSPKANSDSSDANSSAATATVAPVPFTEDEFHKLSDRVTALESKESTRTLFESFDGIVYLKPDDKSWSTLKTSLGSLAISLENVAEYANGTEVTLRIGNPLGASIEGVSAHIEWGRADDKGLPTGEVFQKDVEFTDSLPPSSWHDIKATLPGLGPKELGYVRVKNFAYKTIELRRSN